MPVRRSRWVLTPMHKLTLATMFILTAIAVGSAIQGLWAIVVVAFGSMVTITTAVVLAATSLLTERIERQFRRATKHDHHSVANGIGIRTTGAIAYWAQATMSSRSQFKWFTDQAKKTRSEGSRDIIAHIATKGRYTYRDFSLYLETTRIGEYGEAAQKEIRPFLSKSGLLALAQVLFSQRLSSVDLLNALSIYELAEHTWGRSAITNGVDRSYYSDLLVDERRYDEAVDVLAYQETNSDRALWHEFLRLNTRNPWLGDNSSSEAHWLAELNGIYQQRGFAPVNLREGEEAPFYRLEATASAVVGDTPLVSVLMPIFEPNDSTDLAIASILNQTWRNLELIIVDDGSPRADESGQPTDYSERLQRWADFDARITLVFNDENRGAYWARNTAYSRAAGKYVTVADKDDWHHPQKLELQASELEREPDKIANITNWARVDPDLRFLLRWGPDRLAHPSFASIMFRREEVRSRLGFWDNVRKSGDGEFKFRLEKVYGINLQPTETMPLAFSLIGDDNLTSQDLGLGYVHDERRAYRKAFEAWHSEIESGGSPYLPLEPTVRPFPAPNSFLPERPTYGKFDLLYVSEFGFEAGNAAILRNEIEAAVGLGLRVGVVPVQNFLIKSAAVRQLSREFEQLVSEGAVTWLPLSASAECELLVVRWPAVLQVARDAPSRIVPKRAVVIANHMPYEQVGDRRSYDVTQVTHNVRRIFGLDPTWVPESERVLSVLRGLVPHQELSAAPWKGTVPARCEEKTDPPGNDRIPIIGRHGRDHEGKWPGNSETFRSVYPVDGSVEVAILGGADVPVRLGFVTNHEIASWHVWGFNEISVKDYLERLDFFVYFHNEGMVEAFGMSILEAMNHGVVCILPRAFELVFGDAAVYCSPDEVQKIINQLWNDPSEYVRQREAAYEYVRTQGSSESYFDHLAKFGVVESPASLDLLTLVRDRV